jgi:hypothetical protein
MDGGLLGDDDGIILGASEIGGAVTMTGIKVVGGAVTGEPVGGEVATPAGDAVVGPIVGTPIGVDKGARVGVAVGSSITGDGGITGAGGTEVGSDETGGAVMGLSVPPNTGYCAKNGANPGTGVGCPRTRSPTFPHSTKANSAMRCTWMRRQNSIFTRELFEPRGIRRRIFHLNKSIQDDDDRSKRSIFTA